MAFPLLCWIVLAVFLGFLGLLGLAVTRTVAPDGQGHSRGPLGGCAAALALLFLCGAGCTGLAASVAAVAVGTAVDKNPVQRIEIRRSGDVPSPVSPGEPAPPRAAGRTSAVQALVTVQGDAGGELAELLRGLVEVDPGELDDCLTIHHRTTPEGGRFDVYELRLPVTERDLERFQRDVERELDGLKVHLPESVAIEFE